MNGRLPTKDESKNLDLEIRHRSFVDEGIIRQCTPCREGCGWIDKIIRDIIEGCGSSNDLQTILDVCETMNGKTVCVFAPAVKDIIASIIKKFRSEFDAYIKNNQN